MLRSVSLFVCLLIALPFKGLGQKSGIENAIRSQHFTFRALSVTPIHGTSRQLTAGDYTLKVTTDSLIAYLPYIGAQYNVPTPDEMIYGGYKFAVTNYSYTATAGKHGSWEIIMSVSAQRDKQELTLNCSKSGWGELRITSAGKDPITYYGNVSPD